MLLKERYKFNKSGQRGAILLITLILSVVFAMIAGAVLLRFEHELIKVESAKAISEKDNLLKEIESILSLSKSCRRTLSGRNPNNTNRGVVRQIVNVRGSIDNAFNGEATITTLSDQIIYMSSTDPLTAPVYGNRSMQISSFSLYSNVAIGASDFGEAFLRVDFLSKEETLSRNKQGVIKLRIETDSSGNIMECKSI